MAKRFIKLVSIFLIVFVLFMFIPLMGFSSDGKTVTEDTASTPDAGAKVIKIAGGNWHRLALKSDGTVWAWGSDEYGQLGFETSGIKNTPVQILSLTGVIDIACGGYHGLALKSDGTVWVWGMNEFGQLDDGTRGYTSLTGVIAIAMGWNHSLVLKSDGTVWAWGDNRDGELGDGTYTDKNTPVQVLNLTGVIAIVGGWHHSLALKSDGTVWAWGWNEHGQLGDGTGGDYKNNNDKNTPVQVSNLTGVISIAAGGDHSLALKSDGTLWIWGSNDYGKLGDGTDVNKNTPIQVKGPDGIGYLTDIIAIAEGDLHSLALKADGTVWAWGCNETGQLGDGTDVDKNTPIQVKGLDGIGYLTDVIAIAEGDLHSLALKADGTVWAWGYNYNGQLGDGTTTNKNIPIQVSNLTDIIAIAGGGNHSLALKSDGTVWAWGDNGFGQLIR
ncbi:MAG: hypothetical protein M1269_10110 [Chloroflexi bacterium]|nr:hypothetical protein [Chloroflexota bacterium]